MAIWDFSQEWADRTGFSPYSPMDSMGKLPGSAGKAVDATFFNGMVIVACENGIYVLDRETSTFRELKPVPVADGN